MTIETCRENAKASGKIYFDLIYKGVRKKAKWVDAWLGLFEIRGYSYPLIISDIQFVFDIQCENLRKEEDYPIMIRKEN